jgi:hypothetical protein
MDALRRLWRLGRFRTPRDGTVTEQKRLLRGTQNSFRGYIVLENLEFEEIYLQGFKASNKRLFSNLDSRVL